MTATTANLYSEFVVLDPDKRASVEVADAGLYQRLDRDYNGFKGHELIACHRFDGAWSTWEMHPEGDEIVVLLSGKATFALRVDGGERTVTLAENGDYLLVPKGVWHTARTATETRMLFVTPGEGTENRAE